MKSQEIGKCLINTLKMVLNLSNKNIIWSGKKNYISVFEKTYEL